VSRTEVWCHSQAETSEYALTPASRLLTKKQDIIHGFPTDGYVHEKRSRGGRPKKRLLDAIRDNYDTTRQLHYIT